MDFGTLRNRLAFVLNFNDGQTDQDFSSDRLKQALNHAYMREVEKAKQEGSRRFFLAQQEISWAAGAVTLVLPVGVKRKQLIRVMDVTNDAIGGQLMFSESGLTGDVFWKDRETLQWGTQGPGAAKTLRVFYYAVPVDLVNDADEPELVPDQFHELLVWSAACWLRTIADEGAPNSWRAQLEELRYDFWKYISRGRPVDDEQTIRQRDSDLNSELVGP